MQPLAGFKVRVERTKHAIAEGFEIVQKTPVLEVYLRHVLSTSASRGLRRLGARRHGTCWR